MSRNKVKILGLRISVYTRIARLVCEEKGIEHELEEVDIFSDKGPPEAYLQRHPFGMIPCLLQDDFCLYETTAITRYLDEAFSGPRLQPDDIRERARMNQIVSILDSYAYRRMVWDLYVERIAVPAEGGESDERLIAEALPVIGKVLQQLEHCCHDHQYLAGDSLTLADCHALPMIIYFVETEEGHSMLKQYPALQAWYHRMLDRPSVSNTAYEKP